MKTIIKMVIVLLSLFVSLNAKDIVKVELQEQISVKEKKGEVKAKILFDKNFKGSYEIEGIYKYTKLISGKNKVKILWTKVQKDKSTINIKKPLSSTLITSENIELKSIFDAKGDLKSLNNDLNTVSKLAAADEISTSNVNDKKSNIDSKDADKTDKDKQNKYQNDYSPTATPGTLGTTSSSNGQGQNYTPTPLVDNTPVEDNTPLEDTTSTENTTELSEAAVECNNIIDGNTIQFRTLLGNTCVNSGDAVPIEISTDQCNPSIDYKTKEVFVSSRKVAFKDGGEFLVEDCKVDYDKPVKLQSKTTGCDIVFRKDLLKQVQQEQLYFVFNTKDILIGSCVDSNTTFDVSTYTETNGVCLPLIDYETKKVQFGYRTVANIDGTLEEIEPCAYEETKNDLVSTYEDCTIRDDFTNKKSVQQEKFYYMFENKKVYAGDCQDSNIEFTHYVTDDTCTPQLIGSDKVVFEKRVAYRDINNIVEYLTKCQPSTDGALPLTEEFCGYQHDFDNHQSYPKSKKWFSDPDTGNKIYLTECLKQPFNFPHKQELIRWQNNDIALTGTQHVKLYFTDNLFENIDVYISDNGSDDVALQAQPYVKSVENLNFVQQLGYQRLNKVGNNYIFYGNSSKVIDLGGGLYPNYHNEVINITRLVKGTRPYNFRNENISYGECIGGDILSSIKSYVDVSSDGWGSYKVTRTYTHKDCRKWNYYEEIGKYNLVTDFLRPDGSIFHQSTKEVFRVLK